MASGKPLFCYTDRELFDGLLSGKQHFTVHALLDLARERGILLSSLDDREAIVDRLSVMTFGADGIRAIEAVFETSARAEKTTSFRINSPLTQQDLKTVAEEYRDNIPAEDRVVTRPVGAGGYAIDVEYTETDFARTRLRQRQSKEAHIEIKLEGGHAIVTLPASEKARQVVSVLTDSLFALKKTDIGLEEIDLTGITDPTDRTVFFTKLIANLQGFDIVDVARVKAARAEKTGREAQVDDDEEEEGDDASEQMLGIVKSMALEGRSILSSPQYQAMREQGFFITSITWSSKRIAPPHEIVDFYAGFEEPLRGRYFRYSVLGWRTVRRSGDYIKGPKAPPPEEKKNLLNLIERGGIAVFRDIVRSKESRKAAEVKS